jgi:glycosyltransferase involved in cell wall biosynthesis
MKILYHHRIGSKDGQVVHIEELIHALRQLGHEVIVVGPPSFDRASFGDDAGVIATLKRLLPAALYELLELGYSLPAFRRLWRAYRRERPDALYERYNLYLLAGLWLKRLTGIPLFLEVNAPLADERSRFGGLANKRLAHWAEELVWRGADRILSVTQVLADRVERAGVDRVRVTVIPNGVAADFLNDADDGAAVRQRYGIDGRVVLGFTGFVRDWHGLDVVVDLIADCGAAQNLHLLIVGDGPAVPTLRERAVRRGIAERVTFAGVIPRTAVASHVAAFDLAIQPRVVDYASPLKLFEYMALGRPIVAPATANIREILSDGDNALLFDPADDTALRAAVARLCADSQLRRRLGQAARATIDARRLTWANNACRVVALFDDTLGSRREP